MNIHYVSDIKLSKSIPNIISFHRTELAPILSIYGKMVAAGEWRDYGISTLKDVAIFSVFRKSSENPIYRIEKRPQKYKKQSQYSIVGIDNQILKRGNDLNSLLRYFNKKLIRSVSLT